MAFVLITRREISRVRSAAAYWNAETLRTADGHIRAHLARRTHQR